jgi:hypothetical protein
MIKKPLKQTLGTNVFAATGVTTKLPQAQCTGDKLRLIEKKKATIKDMKNLLYFELANNSTYSAKTIKDICKIVQSTQREDVDKVLMRLLTSTKVSRKCQRIAQIILDEEQGIDEAKKAIQVFQAHNQKSKSVFDRMRENQVLLARTGKQPAGR